MMSWGAPEQGWRKGPWTSEEDKLLIEYVSLHGEGRWSSVSRSSGLNRNGKSCRLRWVNYLRPGLKRGQITPQEEGIILELHSLWGNKWSAIARYLPGRTDNEIKNYWRTHFKKKDKPSKKQQIRKAQILKQLQLQPQDLNTKAVATNHVEPSKGKPAEPQEKREMDLVYPTMEEFLNAYPEFSPDAAASWSGNMKEDGLWNDLWSMDHYMHGGDDNYSQESMAPMQYEAAAMSWEGDYYGSYNF